MQCTIWMRLHEGIIKVMLQQRQAVAVAAVAAVAAAAAAAGARGAGNSGRRRRRRKSRSRNHEVEATTILQYQIRNNNITVLNLDQADMKQIPTWKGWGGS